MMTKRRTPSRKTVVAYVSAAAFQLHRAALAGLKCPGVLDEEVLRIRQLYSRTVTLAGNLKPARGKNG